MRLIPVTCVVFLAVAYCSAQTPIDTAEAIAIGGIRQYITIKSKDRSLPLLLFLHGGPGQSVMRYSHKFSHRLQEHFVVVHWDQRGTGKTEELNTSPTPLSLRLLQKDAKDIITALLKKFGREKLYLVAHSWGTALGFHIARECPDLLYAYVPIGAMVWQAKSERTALALMKARAMRNGSEDALTELSTVQVPFGNGEQLYFHRKWLQEMSGSRKLLSRTFVDAWAGTWLNIYNEASAKNLWETMPEVRCPIYFMAGRADYQTNSSLAEKYFTMLSAPKKGFFWFESCGHAVPTCDPLAMQALIIERVLPETYRIQRGQTIVSDQ